MSVTCSVCNRKRNVPRDVAQKAGDKYVCMTCQEERAQGKQP